MNGIGNPFNFSVLGFVIPRNRELVGSFGMCSSGEISVTYETDLSDLLIQQFREDN